MYHAKAQSHTTEKNGGEDKERKAEEYFWEKREPGKRMYHVKKQHDTYPFILTAKFLL